MVIPKGKKTRLQSSSIKEYINNVNYLILAKSRYTKIHAP